MMHYTQNNLDFTLFSTTQLKLIKPFNPSYQAVLAQLKAIDINTLL